MAVSLLLLDTAPQNEALNKTVTLHQKVSSNNSTFSFGDDIGNDISSNKELLGNKVAAEDGQVKIAFLMTYPNSGTTYTHDLVATLANVHIGTQYSQETRGKAGAEDDHIYCDSPLWFCNLNAT